MKQREKTTVGRREFLRVLGAGAGAAAATAVPLASTAVGRRVRPGQEEGALSGNRAREDLLSRQSLSELREAPVLIKRTEREARRGTLAASLANQSGGALDRRTFLRRSGVAAGGLAALGTLPLGACARPRPARRRRPARKVTTTKAICTHCSVGCTVIAEVANGVWIGQEPGWDSPINRGSHCAKGASVRELVHGDRRLKYPMKMVNGQWTRISWDRRSTRSATSCRRSAPSRDRTRSTGSARPSSPTKAPI